MAAHTEATPIPLSRDPVRRLRIALIALASLLVFGTLGYVVLEGMGWFDGLYMTIITISTVGFGELGGELSKTGRMFTAGLILSGVILLAYTTANLLETIVEGELAEHSGRKRLNATIAGLKHQRLNSSELRETLAACAERAAEGSVLAAQVRAARRKVDRAVRVPERLAREIAAAKATGLTAWRRARKDGDFSLFAGPLERMVELKREEAAAVSPGRAYDALIDEYEPGATEAQLALLFRQLRETLSPLVRAVAESGVEIDESLLRGDFPGDRQLAFARRAAEAIGFDFGAGRLDPSTHPMCVPISHQDVRLTYRLKDEDLRPCVFGILHESGHGLYEQGLVTQWHRTPIGEPVSLGFHESQSRLWENHVGRSRGFWRWAQGPLRETQLPELDVDALWPALHRVKPSFIRVEADEATYNLHIVVRFEIERALFAGEIEVAGLPSLWDDLYDDVLGIRPPDPTLGILQDIHWSQGMFGYFPTYTLGNLIAAQLYAAAERDLGDLDATFAVGDFRPLLDWLRQRVHRQGNRYLAGELVERVTGRPLAADDLLVYLQRNAAEVYGLRGR